MQTNYVVTKGRHLQCAKRQQMLSSTEKEVQTNLDEQHSSGEFREIGTMTDNNLTTEINTLKAENESLRDEVEELKTRQWSSEKISGDDKATQFYTGLPTFAVFMWLFRYLEPKANRLTYWNGEKKTAERQRCRSQKLSLIDQFLSVLMRLKVGLFVKDIADRFGISLGTYSKIFNTWIILLQKELVILNPYPSKALVQRFLPAAFKKYPNTRIVIDCTEVFIEKPSTLPAQNETFSNYKHHNTLKFLVGISPGGLFTFVSKGRGGRVSDREIVKGSGFLDLIKNGDNIMADKGFTIEDLLNERSAFRNIPPFLGQNSQFSENQIQQTRDIAEVRIHVGRAIGRLMNFHILDGVLPLSLNHCVSDIFSVCAYLTNLSPPIVPTNM
ncbi:hypothetical protein LOTGIDRAFT_158703 [Lottia gigantea]|uniref:DDE Tnp4 domain-containing protein n=1 Tax=Lottia gigantea TaxID=225164 RepID=V4ANL1_LOTGI|nr:hypothetical protein LOTGIDRAFT_158703 [Lottia gigantea]ESO98757.1 hypothetical protein LOTGIDRAFT_158703 [Lottia gigantea]